MTFMGCMSAKQRTRSAASSRGFAPCHQRPLLVIPQYSSLQSQPLQEAPMICYMGCVKLVGNLAKSICAPPAPLKFA